MEYTDKMRSYMEALEDERRKIQVFERELPLCLELVIQAIERCKQQLLVQGQSSECNSEQTSMEGPVLEEFIPLKGSYSGDDDQDDVCDEDDGDGDGDVHHSSLDEKSGDDNTVKKSDWLRSVQLWNPNPDPIPHREVQDPPPPPPPKEVAVVVNDAKSHENGAPRPFQNGEKDGRDRTNKKQPSARAGMTALDAAASSTAEMASGRSSRKEEKPQGQGQVAAQRKQRRCWSTELHRLFLHALQQLGGPHVATPKQIREVMKVDGLTNDEVKSHLQKYRLHTRRPSPSGHNNASAQAPQFVLVGGIWMQPPDFRAAAATKPPPEAASNGIYAPVAMLPQPLRPSHEKCGFITSEERGNNSSSTTSSSTHTITGF